MTDISDGHCHIGSARITTHNQAADKPVNFKLVLNGTAEHDWPEVLALGDTYPGVVLPQLGLHPWCVPGALKEVDAVLLTLRQLLEGHPSAGVGECGLDKSGAWAACFDNQLHAFRQQIGIAISLGRPLSVHCVRCSSHVYDEIKTVDGRVPVLLHGWSGSAEMTKMFAQLDNVYFSLNLTLLNRAARAKSIASIRSIPPDRIVLESDGPDGRLRSLDDWNAWFRDCCLLNSTQNQDKNVSYHNQEDLDDALHQGSLVSVKLMAIAVGAALDLPPEAIMAQSIANIEQIFVRCNESVQ